MHEDLLGYMMTSYRNLSRNDGLRSKSSTTSASGNFNYRNPFTTLFMSLNLYWMNSWRNTLSDVRYNGIVSSSTRIPYSNTSPSYGINFSLGQSIDDINSEVKIFASYNKNKSVSLNQGVISEISNDSYSISPSIITDISKFMIVKYNISNRFSQNKIRDKSTTPIYNVTQNLSTSVIPIKNLVLNVSFNHYFNNLIESKARSSWFGNASAKYKLKNVDFILDWTNIFNTKQFITYSYSDVSSYYSEYNLRPTEILLRVRFKII